MPGDLRARRSPLASLRDRWKFQLSKMPQGDARAQLRSCIADLNLVIGEAMVDVLQAVQAEPSGPVCDACGKPTDAQPDPASGIILCGCRPASSSPEPETAGHLIHDFVQGADGKWRCACGEVSGGPLTGIFPLPAAPAPRPPAQTTEPSVKSGGVGEIPATRLNRDGENPFAASVKAEIEAAARLLDEHAKAHGITFIRAPAPRPEETRPGTRRDANGVEVHTNPPFGTADEEG